MDKPPNYFEGILQIRDSDEEVLDFVESQMDKDERGGVAKVKRLKNGYDYYVQSNEFLKKLKRKLENSFSGQTILTAKLHTRDKQASKNLYRLTLLFRQSPYKKGEKILVKGESYEVMQCSKKILTRRISDGRKKTWNYDELKELKAVKQG